MRLHCYTAGIILFLIGLTSCLKESNSTGQLQFSCNTPLLKTTGLSAPVSYAVISIADNSGKPVYENYRIELFNQNGDFISNPVLLKPGSYRLSSFMLADKSDSIIYVCPKTGSSNANLVPNPLCLDFNIEKDVVTRITPEVIETANDNPEDFGYTTFSSEREETFDFFLNVYVYNDVSKDLERTSAVLKIRVAEAEIYLNTLSNIPHKITLCDKFSQYELNISKAGYKSFTQKYSAAELKVYSSSSGPLKVILNKDCSFPDGAVAYYSFSGNANDESGNQNNGNVIGATLCADRNENANSAYYFDGVDDYIQLPLLTKLNNVPQITLSFWLNSDFSFGGSYSVVFGHWKSTAGAGSGNIGMEVFLARPSTQFNGGVCSSMISGESDWSPLGLLPVNMWTNVVIVYDGSKSNTLERNAIYVNGMFKGYFGNPNIPSMSGSVADMTIIGAQVFKTIFNFYKGKLDDIGVWNRAMTPDEIVSLATCR